MLRSGFLGSVSSGEHRIATTAVLSPRDGGVLTVARTTGQDGGKTCGGWNGKRCGFPTGASSKCLPLLFGPHDVSTADATGAWSLCNTLLFAIRPRRHGLPRFGVRARRSPIGRRSPLARRIMLSAWGRGCPVPPLTAHAAYFPVTARSGRPAPARPVGS